MATTARAEPPRSFRLHQVNRTPPSFITLPTMADKLGQGLDQAGASISALPGSMGRRGAALQSGWRSMTSILAARYLGNKKS